MDDVIIEENAVVDQIEADSLPKGPVGDEDSDALFEELLQRAEANMSSKPSIQQSQSYAPPSFRLIFSSSRSRPLKNLLVRGSIPKNKLLTNEMELSIVTTADSRQIKPLAAPLSKLQKEKVHLSISWEYWFEDDTFHAPLLAKSRMPFWYSVCAEELFLVIVTLRALNSAPHSSPLPFV